MRRGVSHQTPRCRWGNPLAQPGVQSVMLSAKMLRALLISGIVAAAVTVPAEAQQLDVIRGQVLGPEGKPLEDAKVTATSLSGNVNRSARTDKNGRYTITFPGGEGDYFVEVAAIGYAARRFEVKRTADQEILVADARLQRAAGQLDTVRVVGQRDRPNRNDATPDISGSERPVDNSAVLAHPPSYTLFPCTPFRPAMCCAQNA